MAVLFNKVENPSSIIAVVEERLPASCFLFNQLKFHEKATDDLSIFSWGSGSDTWILTKYFREDWGMMITISAPIDVAIPQAMRQYLLSSGIIDWDQSFLFYSLQMHVTQLITDICVQDIGLVITIHPCHLFHMKPSEALALENSQCLSDNEQVKQLDVKSGTPFISGNWKYAKGEKTNSMVQKSIERFVSGGLYLDGKLVAGAVTPVIGLISMLHTDPEHRRKGYASNVMRFIFKETAKQGLHPCLTSEIGNKSAINFHLSLGLQQVAAVTYIGSGAH